MAQSVLCDMSFTVYIGTAGEGGAAHPVDVLGTDTIGDVREKAAEALQVDARDVTLRFDGEALLDMSTAVTQTVLTEGSEIEARLPEPIMAHVTEFFESSWKRNEIAAALSAAPPNTPLLLDVSGIQGNLTLPTLEGVKHLVLVDSDPQSTNITSTGNAFLRRSESLETIDLSPLSGVTAVGGGFLSKCTSLRAIYNLPPKVVSIGCTFLEGCRVLEEIDLSPLSGVEEIGDSFLWCTGLKKIDLGFLSHIRRVPSWFLGQCGSLVEVDLSPLSSATEVGSWFLFDCFALESLDLTPLSKVESVGPSFLRGCPKPSKVPRSLGPHVWA